MDEFKNLGNAGFLTAIPTEQSLSMSIVVMVVRLPLGLPVIPAIETTQLWSYGNSYVCWGIILSFVNVVQKCCRDIIVSSSMVEVANKNLKKLQLFTCPLNKTFWHSCHSPKFWKSQHWSGAAATFKEKEKNLKIRESCMKNCNVFFFFANCLSRMKE